MDSNEKQPQPAPEMPTLEQAIAEVFRLRHTNVVLAQNIAQLYTEKAAACAELAESNGRIARALQMQIRADQTRLQEDAKPYAELLKAQGAA